MQSSSLTDKKNCKAGFRLGSRIVSQHQKVRTEQGATYNQNEKIDGAAIVFSTFMKQSHLFMNCICSIYPQQK